MGQLYFCSVVCITCDSVTAGHKTTSNINYHLFPFAVRATSHYEAVGKATVAMERMKELVPGQEHWGVRVNDLGEGGLITDPEGVQLS